ncbi:MAG: DNA mismatch endonuclease (patch repair protein) [Oleiphilaceae bacterium]|jgi:DNA mismatch endonuclease (patch repair protein)
MMADIGRKHTKPEIVMRNALHQRGVRYSPCQKRLPEKPDLVVPKYHAVVLVNGGVWHGHNCKLFKWPKTNKKLWKDKINENRLKDKDNTDKLL